MAKDTSIQAFPRVSVLNPYGSGEVEWGAPGMTLREWFAGQAGQPPEAWWNAWDDALEARLGRQGTLALTPEQRMAEVEQAVAAWRVRSADALLVALGETT